MTKNTILIEDSHEQAFFMTVWTPSTATHLKFWHCDRTRYQLGDWESVDYGYIRFRSGDAFLADRKSPVLPGYCFSGASFDFVDLFLGQTGSGEGHDYERFQWGMVLYNYVNRFEVQDSGKGEVKQSWALGLQPGQIWWKVATAADIMAVSTKRAQQGPVIHWSDIAR